MQHRPRLFQLLFIIMSALAAAWPATATAQGDGQIVEITPELRTAVEHGLAYLAQTQNEDGSWNDERNNKHAGISALACLAFMADGHVPGRGKYGEQVQRGLEFILSSSQETGLIAADSSQGPMYGHGFATLFLGEIYGMSPDPRVREALLKAVRLIVQTQNKEGGWRYNPWPYDADISVTICQIMALRSARNAGLSVPKQTIDAAIYYVRQCQNPADGGFRYMLNTTGSAFARSAAGVASLYYAGVYQDDAVNSGLEYLLRYQDRVLENNNVPHYFYGHYYAVQAMFLAGGHYWANWYPMMREHLISRQDTTGKWSSSHGDAYGSSMALLILQVPNRYLPIFQR